MPVPESGTEPGGTTVGNAVLHRLTSRLATLDLDPSTLEMLTAVLNADLDLRERIGGEARQEQPGAPSGVS